MHNFNHRLPNIRQRTVRRNEQRTTKERKFQKTELKGFEWKKIGVLDWWSLMGGGCLREVIAYAWRFIYRSHVLLQG